MKTTINIIMKIIGVLLILPGALWFLQGINVLPGSYMSGDPQWVINGLIAIIVGAGLFWLGSRK